MLSWRGVLRLTVLWPVVLAGCRTIAEPVRTSSLKPARMSPDSVAIDAFFVRFPLGEGESNGPLWADVDEMHLAADVRERLARNGFRVGLVGGQVPKSLSNLMELKNKPAPQAQSLETRTVDLERETRVVRRHMEMRAGVRTDIVATDVQEDMPVLVCRPKGVEGESFCSAQAVLAVKAFPERDGRVRLKIVPEIQHGESRLRYVGTLGAMRIESGRQKRAFEDMAIEAVLAPGHILVMSTLLDRPATLGHRFFIQSIDGQTEQRLLVLRLAQTQHDELSEPADPVPLDVP